MLNLSDERFFLNRREHSYVRDEVRDWIVRLLGESEDTRERACRTMAETPPAKRRNRAREEKLVFWLAVGVIVIAAAWCGYLA